MLVWDRLLTVHLRAGTRTVSVRGGGGRIRFERVGLVDRKVLKDWVMKHSYLGVLGTKFLLQERQILLPRRLSNSSESEPTATSSSTSLKERRNRTDLGVPIYFL